MVQKEVHPLTLEEWAVEGLMFDEIEDFFEFLYGKNRKKEEVVSLDEFDELKDEFYKHKSKL